MSTKIKLRYGTRAELGTQLDIGEPAVLTDEQIMVIGTGIGSEPFELCSSAIPAAGDLIKIAGGYAYRDYPTFSYPPQNWIACEDDESPLYIMQFQGSDWENLLNFEFSDAVVCTGTQGYTYHKGIADLIVLSYYLGLRSSLGANWTDDGSENGSAEAIGLEEGISFDNYERVEKIGEIKKLYLYITDNYSSPFSGNHKILRWDADDAETLLEFLNRTDYLYNGVTNYVGFRMLVERIF